jgi:hypothetical protein
MKGNFSLPFFLLQMLIYIKEINLSLTNAKTVFIRWFIKTKSHILRQ